MNELETTVLNGLPVLIKWAINGSYYPATRYEPAEYPELDYEICDARGRPAQWIEDRMTGAEHQRVSDLLWSEAEAMKRDAEESMAEDRAWERRYG